MTKMEETHLLAMRLMEMNRDAGVPQETFLIEECNEVITEALKVQKEATKHIRGRDNTKDLVGEICDIYASSYILLLRLGYNGEDILRRILYKYRRALNRNARTGEI